MERMMNILFVCSRNEWRSRTAESIFKNDQRFYVRSAGTANNARVKVSAALINWADVIFVMENKHRDKLELGFSLHLKDKELVVLDIADEYQYMDADLIEELKDSVNYFLST